MRKARYLAAGAAALAKPFFIGSLAAGIQLSDLGQLSSPFLRFLLLPQTLPALCLYFLWRDEDKYKAFKPLVALAGTGSIVLLLLLVAEAAGKFQLLLLIAKDARGILGLMLSVLGALAADLLCLLTIIPSARRQGLKMGTSEEPVAPNAIPNKES